MDYLDAGNLRDYHQDRVFPGRRPKTGLTLKADYIIGKNRGRLSMAEQRADKEKTAFCQTNEELAVYNFRQETRAQSYSCGTKQGELFL